MKCGRFHLNLNRPLVMGILNITPDSFSDGGKYTLLNQALKRAEQMILEGVDIIDVGGESTRPGAQPISFEEEYQRIIPLLRELQTFQVPISIDTYKPQLMEAVLEYGADMINDIWGFRQKGALEIVQQSSCGLCVMHMQGEPSTMQLSQSNYSNVVQEVARFFEERLKEISNYHIDLKRVCIDPGFGFGKRVVEDNYRLLHQLKNILPLSYKHAKIPILVGLSRKSMLGAIIDQPAEKRGLASVVAAVCAIERGARLVRVHDVAQTVEAVKIWQAVYQQ